MKNLVYFFILLLILSCRKNDKQEEILPEIKVEIQKFGYVVVAYKDTNIVKFSLDFGDGIITENSITGLDIGLSTYHTYETNGRYVISLAIWDKQNRRRDISKEITISDIPVKPTASFKVELLDNGIAKINNQSKNAVDFEWSGSGGLLYYIGTKVENPTFVYEANGKYNLFLRTYNEARRIDTTSVVFEVKNAKEPLKAEFNGLFHDKKCNISGSNINTFDFSWGAVALWGYSCNSFYAEGMGSIFIINALNQQDLSVQERYEKLRAQLKPGKASTKEWDVRFSKNNSVWSSNLAETFVLQKDLNAQLEILEVQEINQPALIPGMYNKAFWITLRIKADFGGGNNIDGQLRMRYLVYKQ